MKNSDAVILGYGVVGRATAIALGIKDYFDIKGSTLSFKDACKKTFIFVCLPTPTVNGICRTKGIEKIIGEISKLKNEESIIILRSTVIPGTTRRLSKKYSVPIIHHPEFLTESMAEKEAKKPDILVFGSDSPKILKRFLPLYKTFKSPKFKMNSVTSETLKYAVNTFYAAKVVFANQIYDACQKVGADYELVKRAMYKRKWVGRNHLDVWHKGYRGAGGNCLPKDLEAFASFSKLPLLREVLKLNKSLLLLKKDMENA